MASLEDFAKRMTRISVQVENGVEQGVRDCADAVARSVIGGTPADTGRARSNWTVQMDEAYKGLFPARVPGSAASRGRRLLARNRSLWSCDRCREGP